MPACLILPWEKLPLELAGTSQLSIAASACSTGTDGLRGPESSQGKGRQVRMGPQLEESTL